MKITLLAGCALASVLLSGCLSPSAITGGVATSSVDLPTLKEVNRHIELCDRTYGWPFSAVIVCKGQAPVTQTLTAADIAAMVDAAVAKALAPKQQ